MKNKSTAALYALLVVFAGLSLIYYVAGVLAMRQEFSHASRYAREPFDTKDDGLTLTTLMKEATNAGLADGDFLLSIDGEPYTGYAQYHDKLWQAGPGAKVDFSVRKASGAVRDAQVRLAPRKDPGFTLGGYISFIAPVVIVPLMGLIVGYWVVAARPRDINAWLVLILLAFPSTAYGNLDWRFWPSRWFLLLGSWNLFIQVFVFPAFLWFGLLFPERWRVDLRIPWLKYVVLGVTAFFFVFDYVFVFDQSFSIQSSTPLLRTQYWFHLVRSTLSVGCMLLFLVALFDKMRSASTADARRRLRVLLIGSGLSIGPLIFLFTVLPWMGIDPHHGSWFSGVIFIVALFPLTLAYVVIVQRAMDVRILLRMGTKYLLARATLLAGQAAIVAFVLIRFIFPMMQRREHQSLNYILLAVCIGVTLPVFVLRGSISQRLQRWLDRRFFREAYNSELVLRELSQQVRRLTDQDALIDTVLARISDVLHVSQVAILLRSQNAFHLQDSLGMSGDRWLSLPEQSATVQNLMRTSQPATVYKDRPEEWFADAGIEEKELLRGSNIELLLPLPGRESLMGLIALGPKKSEEAYTPADLRILQSVADQTGLTLEIAALVRTLADESAQRVRMNREIEIAREVQQRLFPQVLPLIDGVSLAGMCRPASEVGGDYYDLIELRDGNLGFAIGDVSGKGISASLIMASLRASLRGLILEDPGDLARMMEKVNLLVYESSSSSRYATFFFAIFNPVTRELRYVNAGHNAPLLLKQSTGEVVRLEACGPVVGLLPLAEYESESLTLEPGDLLIGYTDGISEAMTIEDEEWGEERMMAAASTVAAGAARQVLEAIFGAADAFTAGAEQHDDMTVLILQLEATV